jgi:hypothetical protein
MGTDRETDQIGTDRNGSEWIGSYQNESEQIEKDQKRSERILTDQIGENKPEHIKNGSGNIMIYIASKLDRKGDDINNIQ